jgi:hypothetical protein
MVYGMNDGTWPFDASRMTPNPRTGPGAGDIFYLVHYYSHATQVHLRYTIGFKPLKLDGKRHSLAVTLTPAARKRFPAAELRFRSEYIPVANR